MKTLALFAMAGCLAVSPDSDQVRLRDLAAAFPDLGTALPDTPVALAPAPGIQRVFQLPELLRIAARLNLGSQPAREVCVTRPVAPLDAARILATMRAQFPSASIELVEISRQAVPDGVLEFPAAGLHDGYWNGCVRYAGGRRFVVWAKVRVLLSATRVVAAADLKPGPVAASDLRLETAAAAMSHDLYPVSIDEVAGKLLDRPVHAGTAIQARWLAPVPAIARGDAVEVEVRSGAARLRFEGRAQASGALGETIPVLNPATRKRFPARIEGPGKVSMEGTSL